jgi:hypothetical protein
MDIGVPRGVGKRGAEQVGESSTGDREAKREGPLKMDKNEYGYAWEKREKDSEKPEVVDLHQMLHKIDRMVEEFYEIHGPQIKDQGHDQ